MSPRASNVDGNKMIRREREQINIINRRTRLRLENPQTMPLPGSAPLLGQIPVPLHQQLLSPAQRNTAPLPLYQQLITPQLRPQFHEIANCNKN